MTGKLLGAHLPIPDDPRQKGLLVEVIMARSKNVIINDVELEFFVGLEQGEQEKKYLLKTFVEFIDIFAWIVDDPVGIEPGSWHLN